jgi:septal ring factor EnvC (AmiA/AmiB activator)
MTTIRMPTARRIACLFALTATAVALSVGSSSASLSSRYQAGQQRASQLRSRIHGETQRIQGFEGSISSLEARLAAIQSSVTIQEQLLGTVTDQLAAAHARLVKLRADYANDLRTLAAELLAEYEAPPPTVVNVVVDSGGFNELVNGLRDLSAVQRTNVATTKAVSAARAFSRAGVAPPLPSWSNATTSPSCGSRSSTAS